MLKFLNKYKLISFFIVLLILSALSAPIIKNYYSENWSEVLADKINYLEENIKNEFEYKFISFEQTRNKIKSEFQTNRKINLNSNYSFILIDKSDSVKFYSGNYADKIPKNFVSLSTKFHNDLLHTFLINSEEIQLNNSSYRFIFSELIEKKYSIENDYFTPISFNSYLSEKYKIDLAVNYSSDSLVNMDGRNHHFKYLDKNNEVLANITFAKPGRDVFLNNIELQFESIQSILFILLLLVFLLEIVKDIKRKFVSDNVLTFTYIFFILFFRATLYFFKVPALFIEGDFVSPAIYSSSFAWGIASNPLELLISSVTLVLVIIILHKRVSKFIVNKLNGNLSFLISSIAILILFFMTARGYAAALKSVIFDSSINYLNNDSLILSFVPSTVLFSLLLITIAALIILYSFIDGLVKLIQRKFSISKLFTVILTFSLLQFFGFVFDIFQNEALFTPLLRIILVTGVFLIYYLTAKENYSIAAILTYISIFGAVINSILLADFNNLKDERAVKVTAFELSRFDKDFIEANVNLFLFDEIEDLLVESSHSNYSYNQLPFYFWVNSSIKENIINSSFYLFNSEKEKVGSFIFNQSEDYSFYFNRLFSQRDFDFPEVINESVFAETNSLIAVTPIILNQQKFYLGIKINYDLKSLLNSSEPEILIGRNRYLLTNQLLENLLVIQIIENKAEALNQNIKIDDEEVRNLTSINFNDHNDAWKEVFIDEINYKFYFLKSSVNSNNLIAIGLQEKDTPVTLFQFFKIFLIFALFILIYGILVVIINFIQIRKITLDFRTKVAFSLIIVSIAPLLLLAIYFRTITNEKNLDTIFYKLNKRAVNIEDYINSRILSTSPNILLLAEMADKDLGIDFNLYKENKLVYSSKNDFYKAGLLPAWLTSDIYSKLFVKDQNDILSKQSIERYNYNSIFYKTKLSDTNYVIEVNNLFNSILIPLAISDFDIILFGTYSLAAIFIIILSTILANQISLPLRRLTNAAKSASYGDLNLNIEYKRNDEIGDLTNAFNKMLNEIKKMQTDLSAVERETAWKEMAKQVAHEIKNPLTPMKLSMQQLTAAYNDKSPKFDETFLKVSKTILGQIENLKNIASEFSNFARMPIGEMNSVNIKEAINEVSDLFSDEKVKINLVSVNKSIIVLADENHLKRIFINLIRNSIQAQAENINISISLSDESVIILISDDGKGIPENILPKIFEKGFTTKKDGMGLGLNLAKRYLTNISGEIEIQSTSKNGTVFILTLPLPK